MTLFKKGVVAKDEWKFPAADAPLPDGDIVVGRARFLAERDALLARNSGLGVQLDPGESLDGIAEHLDRLSLIVLRIAKYSDGRPYSVARLLRDRHRYADELRATGDVLRDQATLLARAGFDALDVTHPGTVEALKAGTIVSVHRHYQPASAEATESREPGHPWRRRSPPG
jgi:uncharacterized protein (DUF934 family)